MAASRSGKGAKAQVGVLADARRGYARAAGLDAAVLAQAAFAKAGFPDPTFVLRWSEIAGATLAGIAEPVRWQEGPEGAVLTLRCEASASVFLQHETRPLIERLNAYLGQGRIARIRIVSGTLASPHAPLAHPALQRNIPPAGEIEPGLKPALERLARLRAELRTKP